MRPETRHVALWARERDSGTLRTLPARGAQERPGCAVARHPRNVRPLRAGTVGVSRTMRRNGPAGETADRMNGWPYGPEADSQATA